MCDGGSLLPEGWVVLPASALGFSGPGAVRRVGDDWSRPSGGMLRSTALREEPVLGAAGDPLLGASGWLVVHFSPGGGVFGGAVVLAGGVGGRHAAILLEGALQARHAVQRDAARGACGRQRRQGLSFP